MGNECSCLSKNLKTNSCLNNPSGSESYSGETHEILRVSRPHVRQNNIPVPHEDSNANLTISKSNESLANSQLNRSAAESTNRPATYKLLTDEEAAMYCSQKEMLGSFVIDELGPMDISQISIRWYQCTTTREVYRGELKDGKKEGRGEIYWPDGKSFRGYWKNDVRCGPGILLEVDRRVYIGEWKDNKKHGRGVEISPNGERKETLWNEGRKVV